MDKLLKYLNALPKHLRIEFVTACGTTEAYLRKAVSVKQKLGADLCILIDRESDGHVRCEDLRADVDWGHLRSSALAATDTVGSAGVSP